MRTLVVFLVGVGAVLAGAVLSLEAGRLATTWRPTENGRGWVGFTNPAARASYQDLGLFALCLGVVLLAVAAWSWAAEARQTTPRLPFRPSA